MARARVPRDALAPAAAAPPRAVPPPGQPLPRQAPAHSRRPGLRSRRRSASSRGRRQGREGVRRSSVRCSFFIACRRPASSESGLRDSAVNCCRICSGCHLDLAGLSITFRTPPRFEARLDRHCRSAPAPTADALAGREALKSTCYGTSLTGLAIPRRGSARASHRRSSSSRRWATAASRFGSRSTARGSSADPARLLPRAVDDAGHLALAPGCPRRPLPARGNPRPRWSRHQPWPAPADAAPSLPGCPAWRGVSTRAEQGGDVAPPRPSQAFASRL